MIIRLVSTVTLLTLLFMTTLLTGCVTPSHQAPPPSRYGSQLSDPIMVIAGLSEQLSTWRGSPYREGGMTKQGVDCSGFIYRTFHDHFTITLPRSTREQIGLGVPVSYDQLRPGDLLFFRTGRGTNGMHAGIYYSKQQFIHVSTTIGVTLSSLANPYWKKTYLKARRL